MSRKIKFLQTRYLLNLSHWLVTIVYSSRLDSTELKSRELKLRTKYKADLALRNYVNNYSIPSFFPQHSFDRESTSISSKNRHIQHPITPVTHRSSQQINRLTMNYYILTMIPPFLQVLREITIARNEQLAELENLFGHLDEHRSLQGYEGEKSARWVCTIFPTFFIRESTWEWGDLHGVAVNHAACNGIKMSQMATKCLDTRTFAPPVIGLASFNAFY